MPSQAKTSERNSARLAKAFIRFRDHDGISVRAIRRWVSQFDEAHSELAFKLLENIRYYSGRTTSQMLRELVAAVFRANRKIDKRRIYFVPVAMEPGDSGSLLARGLRNVDGVQRGQITSMAEIENIPAAEVSVIVFLDDFSGTGDQLEYWWSTVEAMVRPKQAKIIVALLVTNHYARVPIERFATLMTRQELTEEDNVLSPLSARFEGTEKDTVLSYCQKTGCPPELVQGYANCGLLLAFRHGCPDNSLPILWHRSDSWRSLFYPSAM